MTERRIDCSFSRTAGHTCFSRACATRGRGERLRGPITLAEVFLPAMTTVILHIAIMRRFFNGRLTPPGIHEYVLASTRLLDAVSLNALTSQFPQVVLLGAGMDTRALRFRDRNEGMRIFELDIETT